jgi:hypothetical protein
VTTALAEKLFMRHSQCIKCEEPFSYASKAATGGFRQYCPNCQPVNNRLQQEKRARDQGLSPDVQFRAQTPYAIADEENRKRLAPLVAAAFFRASGENWHNAVRMGGVNPEEIDMQEVATIACEKYPDLISGSVKGIEVLARETAIALLVRLRTHMHTLPTSSISASLKSLFDAMERANSVFGGSYSGVTINLKEVDSGLD